MFGMALKFLEMNVQPLNILKSQKNSGTENQNKQNAEQVNKKRYSKSSQAISKYQNQISPDFDLNKERAHIVQNKQNIPINQHKTSRVKLTLQKETVQELKQSQIKILNDFKKSIKISVESKNPNDKQTRQQYKTQEKQINDNFQERKLSRIQQLSEEYLEVSVKKQLERQFRQQNIQNDPVQHRTQSIKQKMAHQQQQLIRSIVRSIIIQGQQPNLSLQGIHLKTSSTCKKDCQYTNLQTQQESRHIYSQSPTQPATQFIKNLFQSLGLINESQKMSDSLKQITNSAKSNFTKLKGNDYVQKLHQLLRSIEHVNDKDMCSNGGGELRPYDHAQANNTDDGRSKQSNKHDQQFGKVQKVMKQGTQLRRHNVRNIQEKRVKLVSPQTFTELQSKRSLIQNQISQAIQFLTQTRRVKKFCFDSSNVNEVFLNFSLDFQFMSYQYASQKIFSKSNLNYWIRKLCTCTKPSLSQIEIKQEKPMNIISLPWNLVNVLKGLKTNNLIKHEQILSNRNIKIQCQKFHGERCFSLLFKDRTYDFQCESQQVRDEYFRAIKIMVKSCTKQ